MNTQWSLLHATRSIHKKAAVMLTALTLSCGGLFADWNPEYLTDDNGDAPNLSVLNDQKYQNLKTQVLKALTNSWCSQEKATLLMDLVAIKQPQVCVEIGACTGSTVLPVAATLKHIGKGKIYAIDAWSNEIAVRNWASNDPNKPWWSKVDMKALQGMFQNMIKTWALNSQCKVLALPSETAVKSVPDNIALLHLDGDYSEEGSMKDVEMYLPKVKTGGYVLLSGLFTMVNNTQPKLKAFCTLFDSCDVVAEIERDNAVLFKKR